MGVNFVLALILISISCINAQDYAVLDDWDLSSWDADDQRSIFEEDNDRIEYVNTQLYPKETFDQIGHLIHRREAPDTELEGSGHGETVPQEISVNKTKQESGVPAIPEAKPVPAETSQKTDENNVVQISNITEASLPVQPEEPSKFNETKTEPEPNLAQANIPIKPEEPSKSNKTKTAPEPNLAQANLPVKAEEPSKSNKTKTEPATDLAQANLAVEPEEPSKSNETKTESEPKLAQANLPVKPDEPSKSNETNAEPKQLTVDNAKVQSVESKTDLPVVPTRVPGSLPENKVNETEENLTKTEAPVPVAPKAVESSKEAVPSEPKVGVPMKEIIEKAANVTVSPTKKPNVADTKKPIFPPLVHNITAESPLQKSETAVTFEQRLQQSTIVPTSKNDSSNILEKEGGSVNSTSNTENKKADNKVLPSDLAEVEYINKQKESESIDNEQSGNALLLKTHKGDGVLHVEGSEGDKALKGMAENAKISNEPTEQPNTGESAKNVSRAGKDTTILVVLFIVVIAIGGAAFAHNYIKKRKENASSNSDLVNGIRRSLQNLSSNNAKNNTDVEQGTEMKPLMKNNTLTKEYTDTKKEETA